MMINDEGRSDGDNEDEIKMMNNDDNNVNQLHNHHRPHLNCLGIHACHLMIDCAGTSNKSS